MNLPGSQELQTLFSGFLFEAGLSAVSVKNYLSDIRHFLAFCNNLHQDKPNSTEEIFQNTSKYIDLYLADQKRSFTPKNTTNRRLASIRRFITFLSSKFGINSDASTTLPSSSSNANSTSTEQPTITKILDQFKSYLVKEKKSHSTIKNYISDLNHFFAWSANSTPFMDQDFENLLSESQLNAYVTYLRLNHTSTSVINRRQSSIKQLAKFCFLEKYLQTNPFELKVETQKLTPLSWIERFSSRKKSNKTAPKGRLAVLYHKYNSLSFTPYLHLAILVLATSAMVIFGYNQIIRQAKPSSAALPTVPRRQLSFQGRLTDSSGTPISTAVNVVFKLWNASVDGTQLYTSSTCSITPDPNGIFNTLIGDGTCGQEIASTVFTENRDVYLEVSVGAETLTPRQQIATVGYALNSETLQGYPASSSATVNTVPVMDQNGNITLASSSPNIISTSGTFTLTGEALTLTTAANSGGDIILQPDAIGGGQVQILGATTDTDTLRIENANLTSGSLISGYIGNNTATGRLLSLTSGSTETDRFYVGANGQTTINASSPDAALIVNQTSTGDLFTASASGINQFIIKNSGNVGIGLTNPSYKLDVAGDINTTGALRANGSAGTSGQVLSSTGTGISWVDNASLGTNYWQRTSGSLAPLNITDSLNLGSTATSSALVHLAGTAGDNSWINTGNFGIGTSSPTAKLDIKTDSGFTRGLTIGPRNTVLGDGSYIEFNTSSLDGYGAQIGGIRTGGSGNSNALVFRTANTERMRVDSSGNVTIGSDVAQGRLFIQQSSETNSSGLVMFNSAGTGSARWWIDSNNVQRIDNGSSAQNTISLNGAGTGSVGIGLTNPSYKLDVAGDINTTGALRANGSAGTSGQVLSSTGTGISWVDNASLGTNYWQRTSGSLAPLNITDSLNLGSTATSSALVHLAGTAGDNSWINTGNFGIGTTAPGYKLEVSTGNATGIVHSNASGAAKIFTNITSDAGRLYLRNSSSTNNVVLSANSDSYFIGGNVGIGTTTPTSKLDINLGSSDSANGLVLNSDSTTNAYQSARLFFNNTNDVGSAFGMLKKGSGSNSYLTFTSGATPGSATGSDRMVLSAAGNLGIGTTAPAAKLHVYGSGGGSDQQIRIENVSSSGTTSLKFYDTGAEKSSIISYLSLHGSRPNQMGISNNGVEAISINAIGSVGIGTTAPTARLQVHAGSAATVGQIIRGAASQTANLQEWQNSGGTLLSGISSSGNFGVGKAPESENKLTIWNVATNPTAALKGINNTTYITNTGASSALSHAAYAGVYYVQGTENLTNTQHGINQSVYQNGTAHASYIEGGRFSVGTLTAGTAGNMYALRAYVYSPGAGTITNLYGLDSNYYAVSATNMFGVNIASNTGSAGTSKYGLKIGNVSGASTNNYAIYTDAGLNRLGDQLSIVGSADRIQSIVRGYSSQTANLQEWQNSSGTSLVAIDATGNVGIGLTNPSYKLDVAGDINLTNGIRASGSFGTAGQVLSTTGSVVEWIDMAASSGSSNWQRTDGSLAPLNITDSLNLGSTATSSALVHLTGTAGDNSWINTGNFGIGLTNPSSKLQVAGSLTSSDGNISLNHDSNYTTNINTGTSTGSVTIGGGSNGVAVNSTTWKVSLLGAVSGVTTLNMSGQLTSTVATGTAPFVVSSTTLNTNLNADLLDGQHGSYYAPLTNVSGTTNRLAKFTEANSVGDASINDLYSSVAMTIDASGKIGIGTPTPGQFFQVGTGTGFQVNADGAIINANGATISGSVRLSALSTGIIRADASGYLSSSAINLASADVTGTLPILNGGTNNTTFTSGKFVAFDGTSLSSTAYDQNSFESALTFSNGLTRTVNAVTLGGTLTGATTIDMNGNNMAFTGLGNFGIGAASPSQKLDVAGFFVVDTVNSRVGIGTTTPVARVEIAGSTSTISNTSGDITINSASDLLNFSGDSLVNFLNATASGQIKLGSFADAGRPISIGAGSLIYSTTQGNPQYYDGTNWQNFANYFSRTSAGVLYPTKNWFDSINLFAASGDGATSSAKVRLSGDTANNTFFVNPIALGFTAAINQPRTSYTFALQTSGGILPKVDATDRLGYTGYQWKELYLSNDIIKGSTAVITLSNYSLTGATWHADQGFKVGDTTALGAGLKFEVSGNASVSGTLNVGGSLVVGMGVGKIDAGTIDPPYTINGKKYATYMASMIGIKEETVGKVTTTESSLIKGLGYRVLIDLDQQPVGSDIWLFSNTTNIQSHIHDLSVLLTPEGQAKVWYEVDTTNKILAIYSSTPTNITYRLTAPRFDSAQWTNVRDSESIGHVINDNNIYSNTNSIFDNPTISPELIAKLDGTYSLKVNGKENKEISSFASSIIANLKAGAAVVGDLVVTNLTIKTKLVSPIADIDQLKVIDATISGTLYANNIKGQTVDALNSQINLLNEKYATASSILADLQAKYSSYDQLINTNSEASASSDPLALSPLATTSAVFPTDLALNSLNVNTLISNDILANDSIFTNSLSAFDNDLFIQPAGDKPVHLLANLMTLYPDGKVLVNGDLLITGTLYAKAIDTQTATVSGTLAVGSSTIASESANFNQLTTSGLIIASGNNSSSSSANINSSSNATIGNATIVAGTSEIAITNNKVTDTTLIYVTPTSDTNGKVLYIKSKASNLGFIVGLSGNINSTDISFNYWLVETK
jgi:site-specific recombinase XerD